ncbi:MAG: transposase, partial [Gammaproteobacteria bacterium]|nr:transposase [Gammaproteobacteria bacterium]
MRPARRKGGLILSPAGIRIRPRQRGSCCCGRQPELGGGGRGPAGRGDRPGGARADHRRGFAVAAEPNALVGGWLQPTRTHDDKHHGTVTLFASCPSSTRSSPPPPPGTRTGTGWTSRANREAPDDVSLHLVADNYATHKHAKVNSWMKWHNQRFRKAHGIDRVVKHFTPTSSSWMNLVERFFRDLTKDVILDGSFASVGELIE